MQGSISTVHCSQCQARLVTIKLELLHSRTPPPPGSTICLPDFITCDQISHALPPLYLYTAIRGGIVQGMRLYLLLFKPTNYLRIKFEAWGISPPYPFSAMVIIPVSNIYHCYVQLTKLRTLFPVYGPNAALGLVCRISAHSRR